MIDNVVCLGNAVGAHTRIACIIVRVCESVGHGRRTDVKLLIGVISSVDVVRPSACASNPGVEPVPIVISRVSIASNFYGELILIMQSCAGCESVSPVVYDCGGVLQTGSRACAAVRRVPTSVARSHINCADSASIYYCTSTSEMGVPVVAAARVWQNIRT